MINVNMKDDAYVQGLQQNVRTVFESPSGQEVLRFLEVACGWYNSVFDPNSKEMTLVNDGKRQVIATIKTLLQFDAKDIARLAREKEGE